MLNKKLLMVATNKESDSVLITVGKIEDVKHGMFKFVYTGWNTGSQDGETPCGSINKVPYWINNLGEKAILSGIFYDITIVNSESPVIDATYITSNGIKNRDNDILVEFTLNKVTAKEYMGDSGRSPVGDGDYFYLNSLIGKEVEVAFTPPQTVTFKSFIKQLFKLLEGCLDVGQRTFDDGEYLFKRECNVELFRRLLQRFDCDVLQLIRRGSFGKLPQLRDGCIKGHKFNNSRFWLWSLPYSFVRSKWLNYNERRRYRSSRTSNSVGLFDYFKRTVRHDFKCPLVMFSNCGGSLC